MVRLGDRQPAQEIGIYLVAGRGLARSGARNQRFDLRDECLAFVPTITRIKRRTRLRLTPCPSRLSSNVIRREP